MDALSLIRKPIESDLERYRALFLSTLQHTNPLLDVALSHLAKRQGKLMRPIMVLLSARYVGEVNEAVLHAAVALELLHTASLVHDDVVDESDRRRGQRSVNALLDNKAAVLVGDFLLSKALQHAAATQNVEVVEQVAKLGQILADGELLQLANIDSKTVDEESYYEVIRKKTASLFATCGHVGAKLGGGNVTEIRNMEAFGEHLGICFQLRDDIFDYDASHDVGKPTGNDMKEGKLTLPLIHSVLIYGGEEQRQLALKVREGSATEEDISELVRFTLNHNGIEYAVQQMHTYCDQALDLLENNRDPEITESLKAYVKFVADRDI